jgi:hypothetical protein
LDSLFCFFGVFSILVNNSAIGIFNFLCGLRHGDPLFSFLFVIVMEVSSKMIFASANGGFFLEMSMCLISLIFYLWMTLRVSVRQIYITSVICVACSYVSKLSPD